MTGVGRAAVANRRRRHDDFPAPVGGTAISPEFALAEVQAWLTTGGLPIVWGRPLGEPTSP